jgi:hypothetical protein
MSRTDIFYRLPTDLVEYIFTYLTLEEFHNIGWVALGDNDYKKFWKKSQLLNWKDVYVHTPIPYEFVDNSNSYIAAAKLLKGPAIIKGMYNQSLLKFIYHYYWKSRIDIDAQDGKIILQRHIPMGTSVETVESRTPIKNYCHLIYTNPFMYDTIMALIKFMPYKKKRFEKFLTCRQKICDHINEIIDTNLPIIYSWKQVTLKIPRINLGEIQNLLLCSKTPIPNLEQKIQHIVDSIPSLVDGVPLQTFSWDSYNNHPELLVPMIGNIENNVNLEFDNSFVNDIPKYKTLVTHFYPFIYDQVLKESIEQTLSLCKTTFHNTLITHPLNLHINNANLAMLFTTIAELGKTRLEILLENIPHRYALLTFGDKTRINEMGIILSVSIIKSKLLSPFHNDILIKICKTYFNLWFEHIHQFNNSDQDSIVKSLKIIGHMDCFKWNPNNYYKTALVSKNDYLIKYVVDNIPYVTKEHYRLAAEQDISPIMNEYIMELYSYHKYSKGLDATNIILIICIIIFVICISILKSKKRLLEKQYNKTSNLMTSIRLGSNIV